jgi:hypothetical protein
MWFRGCFWAAYKLLKRWHAAGGGGAAVASSCLSKSNKSHTNTYHSLTPRRTGDAVSTEHHQTCSRNHVQLYKRRYEETESTAATDLICDSFCFLARQRLGPQLLQDW